MRKRQRVDRTPDRGERTRIENVGTPEQTSMPNDSLTPNLLKERKNKNKKEIKFSVNSTSSLQLQREKESESMQKYLDTQSEKGNIEVDMLKVEFETKKIDLAIKKLDFNLKLMQHHKTVREMEERFGKVPDGLIDL